MITAEITKTAMEGHHPATARQHFHRLVAESAILAEVEFGYRNDAGLIHPYGSFWYSAESVDAVLAAVRTDHQKLQGDLAQDAAVGIQGGVDTRTGLQVTDLARLYVNGTVLPRYHPWHRQLHGQLQAA